MKLKLSFLLAFGIAGFLGIPLHAQDVTPNQDMTPNNEMMKTDLLVVTAHPDDESMMAATMARYADEGKVVSLVVCTHGEGGGNSTGKESGAALGIVREAELRRCLALLGTRYLVFLNEPDWAYTESVQATFARWGHDESLRRLVRIIRVLRPDVIATMDPAPTGGQHGHHQAAGRLATEAFTAAADPKAFPDLARDEGLAPWKVHKIYWAGGGPSSTTEIATDGAARGVLSGASPGMRYSDIARLAERSHRSQGFDRFSSGAPVTPAPSRPDHFILVKSRDEHVTLAETDFFQPPAREIERSGGESESHIVPDPPAAPLLEAHIQPGPAVRNYRDWLRSNGIARLLARLPVDVPVTIGGRSPVTVEVTNRTGTVQTGFVELGLPAGVKADAVRKRYTVTPGREADVVFQAQPGSMIGVGRLDVTARIAGSANFDSGKLDALPQMHVARLARTLPVDADVQKWVVAHVRPKPIPPTNIAQGPRGTASEASGRFFVAYDSTAIQVLVEVTDDTVAANIAPDDIKAHWRSTSTEICIDPAPRAENTFGTLKLGIIPADTAGHVRGDRDADANPGPVDRLDPDIRLASRRTAGGYVVEARIPWKSLRTTPPFRPAHGRELGFNVILYHAGETAARTGEDINKSRLAWSFWPGVWGRPDVWGTAVLD